MKKTFLLVIIMVFSVGLVFSQAVPYVGEWKPFNDTTDGGNSTITMTTGTKDGMTVYTFKGEVSTKFEYGFAGWQIVPDAATLTNLRTAKGISFKCIGDGKRYSVKYCIGTVSDGAYHEFSINTETGKEISIEVPIRMFMQPLWGDQVPLNVNNQRRATEVSFQTHEVWRVKDARTPFEITVWDLRIMQ